jgi:hypothetical protein
MLFRFLQLFSLLLHQLHLHLIIAVVCVFYDELTENIVINLSGLSSSTEEGSQHIDLGLEDQPGLFSPLTTLALFSPFSSLAECYKININECDGLFDVSSFIPTKCITLSHCHHVNSITALIQYETIKINFYDSLRTFRRWNFKI